MRVDRVYYMTTCPVATQATGHRNGHTPVTTTKDSYNERVLSE